jgi:hypothetical protein
MAKILFNVPYEDYVMRGMHIIGNVYMLKKVPQKVIDKLELLEPYAPTPRVARLVKPSRKAIDRIIRAVKELDDEH